MKPKSVVVFAWATALLCFAIPLMSKGIMIPIILWILAWFFVPKQHIRHSWNPILIFSGIYIFHLIGMLYTENCSRGTSDLEQKLSLLAFPLMWGFVLSDAIPNRRLMIISFVLGVVVSVLVSFAESFSKFQVSGLISDFYMSEFPHAHHPSYLALYMNFAIAWLLLELFKGGLLGKWKIAAWVALYFLSISLIFPASKMGFIQFVFILPFVLAFAWRYKSLRGIKIALFAGLFLLFGIMLRFDPVASQRVSAVAIVVAEGEDAENAPAEIESSTARLHAWRLSFDEILKNPFGVGTGDINDVMVARFSAEGLHELAEKGLNPHNNYLQIGLALGIPALLWFVFSLIYPIPLVAQRHDWLYAFFLLSIALHFMVESMLEKQSGVVFFAFFNALLFFSLPQKEISPAEVNPKDTAQ